ncbi:MAG TPA: hypothetical protein VGQ32_04490 [Thermoanaerobaculia bacterium]|jgi:hypothetical protein|nr:hypothetical protein [Thermoanaerobaculia bacterium]
MSQGARIWILTVVLALTATSWLISQSATPPPGNPAQVAKGKYPTPAPPYPKAKNWKLKVGPDACDVTEAGVKVPVAVITRELHSIKYQSDSGHPLGIILHAPPNYPKATAPFKNMTSGGVDEDGSNLWVMSCQKDVCSSGPAIKGSQGGYWKTDQILDGKKCDAGIIIQP